MWQLWLPPLPVIAPLAVAGFLLVFGHALPRRLPDVIAVVTALAVLVACLVLLERTAQTPILYWFGNWQPRGGFPLGVGFLIEQSAAVLGAFIATLFAATLVFAWGYYDEVHAHFHVLMMLFMAGMVGFAFTHDLFNMFVWFELMSVSAFALTGYQLRTSALEGALNFTITNAVGGYLFLAGIGLIYARLGVLDFSALQQGVAAHPDDIVIKAAFTLLSSGLLIKGAQVPFQAWLSDAHSVAPSPVSVLFSGVMVGIGIYGIAKLAWAVFSPSTQIVEVIRTLLLGMGAFTMVVGGVMALLQRHIKRLLAFSTISHVGMLLAACALWSQTGLAGMFVYLLGHGLVKGSLFMVAGILLALCGSIDELDLRGQARQILIAGLPMAAGGLLLGGLPVGLMSKGTDFVVSAAEHSGHRWLLAAVIVSAACTGGAVLRACGRVFLGLGRMSGEEQRGETDDDREKADRPLWLMLLPTFLLLALALPEPPIVAALSAQIADSFMHPNNSAVLGLAAFTPQLPHPLPPPGSAITAWPSVILAVLIAAASLLRHRLPRGWVRGTGTVLRPAAAAVRALHSGDVRQYVAWSAVGIAAFVWAFIAVQSG